MSTSTLYAVGLYAAYLAGAIELRARPTGGHARRLPRATLALAVLVAVPTTLQFFFPAVVDLFERNPSRIAAGEWWRLATSLLVQDGGVTGSVFNMIGLLLVGSVAERYWGGRRCVIVFALGGIAANAVALAWQPVGAGNSVANFALAGSVVVACLRSHRSRLVSLTALLALGAETWLMLLKDIHGAAALVGVATAVAMIALQRRSNGAAAAHH